MLLLSAFAAGLLFGLGLVVSQMVNPGKVLAFLDVAGAWDPSLAFVMLGAIAASAFGYVLAKREGKPVFGDRLEVPSRRDFDKRLVGGAILFGIGWGLAGLCPGPALAIMPLGLWQAWIFVAAMLVGMGLFAALPSGKSDVASLFRKVDA
ncbi:DUF6691 family protein [Tardiphaga sp. 839_C3_N1_4]|uniref:DUF6691 family protein n=1 Tax=Tardiphaga sp. 839_C3_N1_4 TaxID=3240761 RepID=UPI003F2873D8